MNFWSQIDRFVVMLISLSSDGSSHALLDGCQILIRDNKSKIVRQSFLISPCAEEIARIVFDPFSDNFEYRLLLIRKTGVQILNGTDSAHSTSIDLGTTILDAQWISYLNPTGRIIGLVVTTSLGLSFWDAHGCHKMIPHPRSELRSLALAQTYGCIWRTTRGTDMISFVDARFEFRSIEIPRMDNMVISASGRELLLGGKEGLLVLSPQHFGYRAKGLFSEVTWSECFIIGLTYDGKLDFYSELLESKYSVTINDLRPESCWILNQQQYEPSPPSTVSYSKAHMILDETKKYLAVASDTGAVSIWRLSDPPSLVTVLLHPRTPALHWQGDTLTLHSGSNNVAGLWSPQHSLKTVVYTLENTLGAVGTPDGVFSWNSYSTEYISVERVVSIPEFIPKNLSEDSELSTEEEYSSLFLNASLGPTYASENVEDEDSEPQDTFIAKRRKIY